jgi:hypothetical protein
LEKSLQFKIEEIVEKRKLDALKLLDDLLDSSKSTPYTQNDYYESIVAERLEQTFQDLDAETKNGTPEMVRKQFFKDGRFQVAQIQALIVGYWKVCYKRIADSVPEMGLNFLGKVAGDLKMQLRTFDLRNAKEMLQEFPEIENKRIALKKQNRCLEECLKLMKKINVRRGVKRRLNTTYDQKVSRENKVKEHVSDSNETSEDLDECPIALILVCRHDEKHDGRYERVEDHNGKAQFCRWDGDEIFWDDDGWYVDDLYYADCDDVHSPKFPPECGNGGSTIRYIYQS